MNKTEIIAKIKDLYECLRDSEYNSWYNRCTTTSWEDSWECSRCLELYAEQNDLIDALETMLADENNRTLLKHQ